MTQPKRLREYLATGEWEVLINHRCDLLTEHMISSACAKHVHWREWGFSFEHPDALFDSRSGDILWKTSQIREIEERVLSPQQYTELSERLQTALDTHRAYLKDFAEKSKRARQEPAILEDFLRRSEVAVATIFYFQLEKGAHKEMERQGISVQGVRSSLTDTTRAVQELERIAREYRSEFSIERPRPAMSQRLSQELQGFCRRFGYLAMKYFQGHPWTVWEAYEMAESAARHPKSGTPLVETAVTSPYVKFLENILRLRTEMWELMCYGSSLFRGVVLEQFADVVRYEDLLSLQVPEAIDVFYGRFPARELLEERRDFMLSVINQAVEVWVEEERETEMATRQIEVQELKGTTAHPGKIRGVVKVVLSPREGSKVKDGDILVATMSTPDFLPAMMRAAAFVTDIGGITSHAAIVSRELNKPCIIGTKIATKVLRDGDVVEVDAERGVVRKL